MTAVRAVVSTNEPTWLTANRQQAQQQFDASQWPPRNQDGWRRIDLGKLALTAPIAAASDAAPAFQEVISRENRAGLLVLHNGHAVRAELNEDLQAKGVQLLSLAEAARTMPPHMMERHIGSAVPNDLNRFTAQNAAAWRDGFFLLIPAEVEVALPFYLVNLADAEGSTVLTRSLIMGARFSKATVVSHSVSPEGVSVYNNSVTELLVGESSSLNYINVQQWGEQTTEIATQRAVLDPNSSLALYNVGLGGKTTHTQVDANMRGDGSSAKLTGLYFPHGNQYMEYDTLQDHAAGHTSSNLTYKGVLQESGRSVFEGMILVQPEGRFSSSGMTNRNLLLSKTAHADSVPNLEIRANEIEKCSHASSLGPVDAEQLFYLQSRGLTAEVATRVIVEGFFEEVLAQLNVPQLHDYLADAVRSKLGDTVAYLVDDDEEA